MSQGRKPDDAKAKRIIGENLKRRRWLAKLTASDLAKHSGLHLDAIAMIEQGDRTPTIFTLMRLAKILECDVTHLLEGVRV